MEESSGKQLQMNQPKRPSGARLSVLKTFDNVAECEAQYRIMVAAPPTVALTVEPMSRTSFAMPLSLSPIPLRAITDFAHCFERLWRESSPRSVCSRELYHRYVLTQLEGSELRNGLRAALSAAVGHHYAGVATLPVTQNVFVHGDATLSNAVWTSDGVRLIDFSPRATPSEFEVDLAKMMFSALGFDTEGARSRVLWTEVERLMRTYRPDLALLPYYLATHACRVASKEPPSSPRQIEFYERVLNYATKLF